MLRPVLKSTAAALLVAAAAPAFAEWKPAGPVKLMIAFRAGGGADTQARLIAEEIETRRGWKIIPQNVTGKGGANMALALKDQPADGLALGMSVSEAFAYNPLAVPRIGYTLDDFTYISSTAGSQTGIIAKASRGWTSLEDVIAAAKGGREISFGAMGLRLEDLSHVIGMHYGVKFNVVMLRGGKAVLNGVIADDIDIGWAAGIQTPAVRSGDVVNLASGLPERLEVSPDAKTLDELGIGYSASPFFLFVGPKGLRPEARDGVAAAVAEVLGDPATKAAKLINRAFGGVKLIAGDALAARMRADKAENLRLLAALE